MIINAVCHRNYMNDSDRIEVTSPGTICRGLTLKDALEGYSKTRNKVIAKVFHHMGLIEELAKITQTTTRSVEKNLKKLKDQNRIARIGAANGGKWEVKN